MGSKEAPPDGGMQDVFCQLHTQRPEIALLGRHADTRRCPRIVRGLEKQDGGRPPSSPHLAAHISGRT